MIEPNELEPAEVSIPQLAATAEQMVNSGIEFNLPEGDGEQLPEDYEFDADGN